MSPATADIEAEITLIATEKGGRKFPVTSGFRPQFHYHEQDWDSYLEYPDEEWIYPGQTARALLWFLSPASHVDHFIPGMKFQLREGPRLIGYGHITKIINLVESAKNNPRRPEKGING